MLAVILVMLSALPGGISVIVYIFSTQDVLTLVYRPGSIQLLIGAALLVGGVAWGRPPLRQSEQLQDAGACGTLPSKLTRVEAPAHQE